MRPPARGARASSPSPGWPARRPPRSSTSRSRTASRPSASSPQRAATPTASSTRRTCRCSPARSPSARSTPTTGTRSSTAPRSRPSSSSSTPRSSARRPTITPSGSSCRLPVRLGQAGRGQERAPHGGDVRLGGPVRHRYQQVGDGHARQRYGSLRDLRLMNLPLPSGAVASVEEPRLRAVLIGGGRSEAALVEAVWTHDMEAARLTGADRAYLAERGARSRWPAMTRPTPSTPSATSATAGAVRTPAHQRPGAGVPC